MADCEFWGGLNFWKTSDRRTAACGPSTRGAGAGSKGARRRGSAARRRELSIGPAARVPLPRPSREPIERADALRGRFEPKEKARRRRHRRQAARSAIPLRPITRLGEGPEPHRTGSDTRDRVEAKMSTISRIPAWTALAEKLGRIGYGIFATANVQVTEKAYSDDKFFALTLLARTAIDINKLIQSLLGLVYMDPWPSSSSRSNPYREDDSRGAPTAEF
jgi:hypothetical protein